MESRFLRGLLREEEWELLTKVSRELVQYGLKVLLTRVPPRYSPTGPSPPSWPTGGAVGSERFYAPVPGCPWCYVARQVAPALIYIQRARLRPSFAAAYRRMADTILEESVGPMVVSGSEVYAYVARLREVQGWLRAASDSRSLENAEILLAQVLEEVLTRAEAPTPAPPPTYGVNPTPISGLGSRPDDAAVGAETPAPAPINQNAIPGSEFDGRAPDHRRERREGEGMPDPGAGPSARRLGRLDGDPNEAPGSLPGVSTG